MIAYQQSMFPDLAPDEVIEIREPRIKPAKHIPTDSNCQCGSCRRQRAS